MIKSMSAKIIAASTSRRRAALTVTSAAREGVLQSSRKLTRSRTSRYSGMYLPACRINQIGVYETGSRRHARIKGLFASRVAMFNGAGSIKELLSTFSKTRVNFHKYNDVQLPAEEW